MNLPRTLFRTLFVVVLLCAVCPGCQREKAKRVNMDLFGGWNGMAKADGWVPVRAEVHIPEGVSTESASLGLRNSASTCSSSYDLAIVAGGYIERECLAPVEGIYNGRILGTLRSDAGLAGQAETDLRMLPAKGLFGVGIGGLIPGFGAHTVLSEQETGFSGIVSVEPRVVYREWGAWLGVDAVWLPMEGALGLDADQWAVLTDWVNGGGVLVVAPGPGWQTQWELLASAGLTAGVQAPAVMRLEEGLEWGVNGRDRPCAEGAGWVLNEWMDRSSAVPTEPGLSWTLRPRDGARVDVLHRIAVGLGSLRIWKAWPEVWRQGESTQQMWFDALSPLSRGSDVSVSQEDENQMEWLPASSSAVQSMLGYGWVQRIGLPIMIFALAVYLLCISVVDYRLVFRFKRPALTWLTLPVWSVVACFLIILGGNWYYRGRVEGRGIGIMLGLNQDLSLVRAKRFFLLEQQSNSRNQIRGNGLVRPLQINADSGWSNSRVSFGSREEKGTLWEGAMERWVKRMYTEDALLHDAATPVQVEKDTDGLRWNSSPEWEIETGYLVEDGQYWVLDGEELNAAAAGSDVSGLLNQGESALNRTGWQYPGMGGFTRGEHFSGDQYAAMFLFLMLGPYGGLRLDDDFLQDIRTAYLQGRSFALYVLNPTDLLSSERRLGWRRAGGVSEEYPIEEKILFFRFFQESNHDQ